MRPSVQNRIGQKQVTKNYSNNFKYPNNSLGYDGLMSCEGTPKDEKRFKSAERDLSNAKMRPN